MAYDSGYEEDRRELIAFLISTHDLLGEISHSNIMLRDGPAIPGEIRELAGRAFDEYVENLPSEPRQYYSDVIYEASGETLVDGGLTGAQRELKLSLVSRRFRRFTGEKLRKWLIRLLQAIDTALDTIVELLGVKHALKELKDTLLAWISEEA
jgi:hypothetical protein